MMGEAEAWKFMDALHENIAVYTHSGSAPCVQAANGERVAGIALDMRGACEKTKGAPIEVIIPKEGTGWDMEATGIVKGTKKLASPRRSPTGPRPRPRTSSTPRPTRSSPCRA